MITLTVVVAILLGGAAYVTRSGESAGQSTVFVSDTRAAVGKAELDASVFQSTISRLGGIGRTELIDTTDGMQQDLMALATEASTVPPGHPELIGPATLLQLAADSWASGVAGVRDGLIAAADDPLAPATDRLDQAFVDLLSGDRLYERFRQAIEASGAPAPVTPWPEIHFVPVGFPITTAVQTFVAAARSNVSALASHSDLAVSQITTRPEWVLDQAGKPVVPYVSELTIVAVVVNAGNAPVQGGVVSLALLRGNTTVYTGAVDVPALDPGSQTVVEFPNLAVTPGPYRATVTVGLLAGGEAAANNVKVVEFRVNEPTSSTTSSTP